MQKIITNILKIMILDINNLYGWAISQKLTVKKFKWVEDLSEFDEDFVKGYNEKINEGCCFGKFTWISHNEMRS